MKKKTVVDEDPAARAALATAGSGWGGPYQKQRRGDEALAKTRV